MYISRIAVDDREQLTVEHLRETSDYAGLLAAKVNVPEIARLVGLLHDMGKFSAAFLQYLHENDKSKRGSIVHSRQGAKYIFGAWRSFEPLLAEIISIVISGHHGGLIDAISPDGDLQLINRLSNTEKRLFYNEVVTAFHAENVLTEPLDQKLNKCKQELRTYIQTCKGKGLNTSFMIHMLTKFLFSCLIDADRYNAYCFEINKTPEDPLKLPEWSILADKLEGYLTKISSQTKIGLIRQDISLNCLSAAKHPPEVYKLEIPTGGGKTLSSLRFALSHAQEYGLQRIIYIIPYLSVLEQTAANIRQALNTDLDEDIVLEHHSNLLVPEDENGATRTQLLTDRWSSPIVITTMVQFLESVYSEKSGKLRKFHNMTKAILIFDEVQSLPVKCVHLFNEAVNFLSVLGGSTVLLCSATQPLLDKVERPIKLSNNPSLIQDFAGPFKELNRTRIQDSTTPIGYSLEQLGSFVLEKADDLGDCLVILNTKADAAKLYEIVKNYLEGFHTPTKLLHLSTRMCPAHRLDVIREIKESLGQMQIICVSTQLIEAGVDISFGCVIRVCAGLDSIAQAAGRCNRNGEDSQGRDVYIVNLAKENLSKLPDIKCGSDITARILHESDEELLSKDVMGRYYEEYFYKRKREMNYRIGNDETTLYDLLSLNEKGCGVCRNLGNRKIPALRQAFQTAGQQFCVIEQKTTDVLVPYCRGANLVEEYKRTNLQGKLRLLREMGRYSVALYPYERRLLEEQGALFTIDEGIVELTDSYYDKKMGVIFSVDDRFLYVGG